MGQKFDAASLHARSRRLWIEWTYFATLFGLVAIVMAFVFQGEHARIFQREQDRLTDQVRVVDDNIVRQLDGIHKALTNTVHDLDLAGVSPSQAPRPVPSVYLKALADAMPGVRSVAILNDQGLVIHASRPTLVGASAQNRDYFKAVKAGLDPSVLYVSAPFTSTLGFTVITLNHTILRPDGRFAGFVSASLDPEYFLGVLRSVIYAPDMWSALAHGDGQQFINFPLRPGTDGMDLAKPGSFFTRHRDSKQIASVLSGVVYATGEKRLMALRTINPPGLGMDKVLVVNVSRDLDILFAPWFQQLQLSIAAFVLLSVVVGCALGMHQRRRRIIEQLQDEKTQIQSDSTETLALALSGADLGLWDLHLPGDKRALNEQWCTMLGFTLQEIQSEGTRWQQRVHPDDWPVVSAALDAHLAGQTPAYEAEYRMRHKAGHWVWILSHGKVMARDSQGVALRMLGTHMNIDDRKSAQARLEHSESLLHMAGHMAHLGGWAVELPRHNVLWSDEICDILEYPRDMIPGLDEAVAMYTNESRTTISQALALCETEGLPFDCELDIFTRHRKPLRVRATGHAVRNAAGSIYRIEGAFQDITESARTQQRLHRLESRLSTTLESMTDAFFAVDTSWRFVYLNREFERLLQRNRTQLLGKVVWEEFPDAIDSPFDLRQYQSLRQKQQVIIEEFYPPIGLWLEVRAFPIDDGVAVYFRDISERKLADDRIRQMAFQDALTQLPNRRLLMDRLSQALVSSARRKQHGALLFIDLDKFKALNDTHGHDKGDLLLQEIARRLENCVRANDTVARLGGDEFVVLLEDMGEDAADAITQAKSIGEKIHAALNQPYLLGTLLHQSTQSIGVALLSTRSESAEEVLKQADQAMYQAKQAGRSTLRVFIAELPNPSNTQV